jgi:hypothetical protein
MSSGTATALSSLTMLSQLQTLNWGQPEQSGERKVQHGLDSLAQLTSLGLGYNVAANHTPPISSLVTVPSKMVNLQMFEIVFKSEYLGHGDDLNGGAIDLLYNSIWDHLGTADLQHLLPSYLTVTTLLFTGMVLDHAGLDLLLAHPHIVNVTLLAIAATQSRVDSPCSWQRFGLASSRCQDSG